MWFVSILIMTLRPISLHLCPMSNGLMLSFSPADRRALCLASDNSCSSNKQWIHVDICVQVILDEYKRIVSCFYMMLSWCPLHRRYYNAFFSVSPTFDVPEIWTMRVLANPPTLGFNSGVKKSAYTRVYTVSSLTVNLQKWTIKLINCPNPVTQS